MIDVTVNKTDDGATVKISGDMNIHYGTELKEVLQDALHTNQKVVINAEDVTDIDLAILQLLCSAHKTALNLNKKFTIGGSIPDVIRQVLTGAGDFRNTGCSLDKGNSCLWIKEATNG